MCKYKDILGLIMNIHTLLTYTDRVVSSVDPMALYVYTATLFVTCYILTKSRRLHVSLIGVLR